jgi:hypothetical protein
MFRWTYLLALTTLLAQVQPPSTRVADSQSTLYLVTEGAKITRAHLLGFAAEDWTAMVDYLDAEGDGIAVSPFLDRRADREMIINDIIRRLQSALGPYGIKVVRHNGPVVEGDGSTTLFLGRSTLSNGYHIASDVDYLNNNRTDVAFVGDEDWGNATATAMALADVALHEASHTYGLYHVNCLEGKTLYPETMGLRYSTTDQSEWIRDTGLLDRIFPEYLDHGAGRGPQNAHRTMLMNFSGSRVERRHLDKEPRARLDALLGCFEGRRVH